MICLIAGVYPAVVLSAFTPIQVLKGRLKAGNNIGFFRKALIIGQFVASIVMIICTITVGKQLSYLQSKNLGYNREHIVIVPTNKGRTEGNQLAERFVTVVQKNPQVINTTTSLYSMAQPGWMQLGYNDNQKAFRKVSFNAVDAHFVPALALQIVAG